jgi:hypothetical protein
MTLTNTRGLVAAGSLAALIALGTAGQVGTAGQAHADLPLLNGTYDIDGGDEDAYWTATSTCATDGCVARVSSNVGWSGNAVMNGGRWNLTVTKPDGKKVSFPVAHTFNAEQITWFKAQRRP